MVVGNTVTNNQEPRDQEPDTRSYRTLTSQKSSVRRGNHGKHRKHSMSMTDPIADMLTRIRNACGSKHRRADMPASQMKLVKAKNFIPDYKAVDGTDGRPLLRVVLKYAQGGKRVIREMRRVSSPGLRKYVAVTEIPRVRNGLGVAILSTSKGLMTDREARAQRTGGELLALVW